VVSFLKELDSTNFVDGVEKITLHQALTMRGGLRVNGESLKKLPQRCKAKVWFKPF